MCVCVNSSASHISLDQEKLILIEHVIIVRHVALTASDAVVAPEVFI